jgi:hypothetical protein
VGIAYWPGAVPDVWGDENTGINPCNAAMRANLVGGRGLGAGTRAFWRRGRAAEALRAPHTQSAAGVQFAAYNVKVDRLSVLKTTFGETRNLLNLTLAKGAPAVVTAVAFRCARGPQCSGGRRPPPPQHAAGRPANKPPAPAAAAQGQREERGALPGQLRARPDARRGLCDHPGADQQVWWVWPLAAAQSCSGGRGHLPWRRCCRVAGQGAAVRQRLGPA